MKVNDSFTLRTIYGKHILMPIRANESSNDPILLNDVGYEIWQATKDLSEEIRVLDTISKLYDLDADSVEMQAVKQFVHQMKEMKLIIDDKVVGENG